MRHACRTSASFCVLLTYAGASSGTPPDLHDPNEIVVRMNRLVRDQARDLSHYSGHRRYTLRNRHLDPGAGMNVLMKYDAGSGKRFTITKSEGLGALSLRVMKNILDVEQASSKETSSPAEINPQHYSLAFDGIETRNGRRCYRISLKPRERTRYLLDGTAWIDTTQFALVHVEGTFARGGSFWTGRSFIQQDYADFDGFWLPSHHRSVTPVRLAGESELEIEYDNYQLPRTLRSSTPGATPGAKQQ